MAFQVSPGVIVNEIDLTTQPVVTSTTDGAAVGRFRWGPVMERTLLSTTDQLKKQFLTPDDETAVDFLTIENYLSYTDKIRVVRVVDEAVALNSTTSGTGVLVKNRADYEAKYSALVTAATDEFIAKYPGAAGDTLNIAMCPGADGFYYTFPGTFALNPATNAKLVTYTPSATESLVDYFQSGDYFVYNNRRYTVDSVTATTITLSRKFVGNPFTGATCAREWAYAPLFSGAPDTDEFHLVITDADGSWSGLEGNVLESYGYLSLDPTAKYDDGTAAYFYKVLLRKSAYIYHGGADLVVGATEKKSFLYPLSGGADGNDTVTDNQIIFGWDLFKNAEKVDVSLIIAGAASENVGSYLIEDIAELRKDCVVFLSPKLEDVVNNTGNEVVDTITTRGAYPSSSYAVMDNNWKYMYDRYNDEYRWIPCNSDFAGLCARTDADYDPWFSPAGFTRGGIKNAIKLAFDADKTDRDELYKNGINSYVDFPDQGKVLYGDKTLLARASAFDRINVRRLFIVLEKSISNFARYSLFEFNDEFTRAQFVGKVEPFLRTVKGRRGVTDFYVVCDERNNTPEVIDSNNFVGDIYIKPARSINYITLNFIATPTGTDFNEIVNGSST